MFAALLLAAAIVADVPSGRPPVGPLERYDPRVYDIRYEVQLTTTPPRPQTNPNRPSVPLFNPEAKQIQVDYGQPFRLRDAPIVMPVIKQGTFSIIDQTSLKAQLWLDQRADNGIQQRARLEDGLPFHTSLAVLPIVEFRGTNIRWNIQYRSQVWSSRINEQAAAQITWPREWPREVADGLKPQMYIESDDPIFRETIERIAGNQLHMVPPYHAAKDIVRYCLSNVKVTADSLYQGRYGVLNGFDLRGALVTAREGVGGPVDLVCVCVAMLRAAGIPARPLIGIQEDEKKNKEEFVVWAEFFLPGCGWIPFDPIEMRGNAINNRAIGNAWPEFGTLDDLNRRVPLSYHFMPAASVEAPIVPGLWGWDPRPNGSPAAEPMISFDLSSRGRGQDDPR